MTRLFIENIEIELDKSVQFAITKEFEDLSNPTAIINDWSKTVSIPFTQKNNKTFGHIYNPDKVTVSNSGMGINFDPLKKLDFRLEWNNNVLMVGYAKMIEIKQNNGKGTYELTLFGQLGKVFQEMKKITFDTTTTDTDYLINGSQYVNEYINRNLVYNCWNNEGQTQSELKKKTDNGYNVTDIIGFAPNNSFSEGFEHTTYQSGNETSETFEETLGDNFTSATGVEPNTVIPNGLLPREIGEYRSYLQLPFIYWNKLFQIFKEKAEELTGYDIELDNEWFNELNPYWYNLVYMLKPLDNKSEEIRTNLYTVYINYFYWNTDLSEYITEKTKQLQFSEESSTELVNIVDFENSIINLENNMTVGINSQYCVDLHLPHQNHWRISPTNGIEYCFKITDVNDNILDTIKCLICDENYTGNTSGYYVVTRTGEINDTEHITENLKYNLAVGKYNTNQVKIVTSVVWLNNDEMFLVSGDVYIPPVNRSFRIELYGQIFNKPMPFNVIYNRRRSYNNFTLNDLWNNDYNLFNEIINYCKMYRIFIYTNDINKKIIFTPYYKYFSNYEISDWTNKIDKSKDFIITPVTFDNKYILFNYDDGKTKLEESYKEKFGVNYGEYRLVTDYNFNNSTTNLFDKINNSIVNTDNVLSWTNLYDNHKIMYSFPAELYVYNKDKDNKQVDCFGSFYFHCGTQLFSTEDGLNLRSVYISDDTTFQQTNNKYFYIDTNLHTTEMTNTLYYTKLDVVYNNLMCLFNVPNENYTYLNNYNGKTTIYTNFWDEYLNERYNIQNKKITCYVNLKPQDYNQFKWNKFVKIGNQLCIVNKIYDYDINAQTTTKVDLITIQDLNAYDNDSFIASIDELTLSWDNTTYYNGTIMQSPGVIGTFTSVSDVTFENGTKEYTSNGVKFTISGNTVYHQQVTSYVDKEDIDFTVTLKNKHYTVTFDCQRYSTYPYPYIELTDSNNNVVTRILSGPKTYTLSWVGTDTTGSNPTVLITVDSLGSGTASVSGNWVEDTVTIQEGGEEWSRMKYSITLNTNITSNTNVNISVLDSAGWNETRAYAAGLAMYDTI